MRKCVLVAGMFVGFVLPGPGRVAAQSSSLYRAMPVRPAAPPSPFLSRAPEAEQGVWTAGRKIDPVALSTKVIERSSLIAVSMERPRPLQPHDLVTVIVREQKKYESNARADNEKKWNLDAALSKWFRMYERNGHPTMGADTLPFGDPAVQFLWDNKFQNKAQDNREDTFTTRITAKIVDVKPNGTVVLEARGHQKYDEEEIFITLTGTCRAADITPDNTILSSQLFDPDINVSHTGAVRDTTRRGWIPRAIDFLRPF